MTNDGKDVLRGAEAIQFSKTLDVLEVRADSWEIVYFDDRTGEKWIQDYPQSEQHGGGSPRLRRIADR